MNRRSTAAAAAAAPQPHRMMRLSISTSTSLEKTSTKMRCPPTSIVKISSTDRDRISRIRIQRYDITNIHARNECMLRVSFPSFSPLRNTLCGHPVRGKDAYPINLRVYLHNSACRFQIGKGTYRLTAVGRASRIVSWQLLVLATTSLHHARSHHMSVSIRIPINRATCMWTDLSITRSMHLPLDHQPQFAIVNHRCDVRGEVRHHTALLL